LPLSISILQISKDESLRIRKAERPRFFLNQVYYMPFLFATLGVIWAFGFVSAMSLKHILIVCHASIPLFPLFFGGYDIYVSTKTIAEILANGRQTSFSQEVKRYDASKRLLELASNMKIAWILVGIYNGLLILWPWFRTKLIYPAPFFVSLVSLGLVQRSLSLSNSGKTFSSNETLALFMYIVRDSQSYENFYNFLKSEFSGENLLFWSRVEEYRSCDFEKDVGKSDSLALVTAKSIYIDFLDGSAVQCVNISGSRRQKLTQWYVDVTSEAKLKQASQPEVLKNLFRDAQREIFALIQRDPLVRFQNTPACQEIQRLFEAQNFVESGREQKETEKSSMKSSVNEMDATEFATLGGAENSLDRSGNGCKVWTV